MHNQLPFSINETRNKAGSAKLGMPIHDDGKCAACHYSEKKYNSINWKDRENRLITMLEKFRKTNGEYDCIVSGSGGKDSVSVAHMLKYKYGMHPLTVTYSPLLPTEIGKKNLENWCNVGGFDNLTFKPSGRISSLLAREAFLNLLHPIQPFKFGIKSFAAKMAAKFNINLVMYGESYAEYGSAPSKNDVSPSYSFDYLVNDTNDIFLGGLHFSQILDKYDLELNDLKPYFPLRSSELNSSNITVEHLGWYIKWEPQEIYYYAAENCGFLPDPHRTDGTYGRYSGIDDKFESLHFFCHYIKFMIGRCRFDASKEIRDGHITREEGLRLAKKFEGEIPSTYLYDCLEFLNISEDEFWQRINEARSPHLWEKVNGEFVPRQELKQLISP